MRLPARVWTIGVALVLVLLLMGSVSHRPGWSSPPPANASLHDTWMRPADAMVMVYVPAGEFEMGGRDADVNKALDLCNQFHRPCKCKEGKDFCKREWFEDEQPAHRVALDGFFGPVTYQVQSGPAEVTVQVELAGRRPPRELVMHLRRPEGQPMQSVTVNGKPHKDFDPASEVVRVTAPSGDLTIKVDYS